VRSFHWNQVKELMTSTGGENPSVRAIFSQTCAGESMTKRERFADLLLLYSIPSIPTPAANLAALATTTE